MIGTKYSALSLFGLYLLEVDPFGLQALAQMTSFWDCDHKNVGSWSWSRLMKLRPLARSFMVCKVSFAQKALFWYDDWTLLGFLLDITGTNGLKSHGNCY